MSSVNKVILIGNLGRDPEVRYTNDGGRIVNLNVATSEKWRDKSSGETKERTEWHRVVIFNDKLGEVAEKYLAKGRTVYLEGSLQTRRWADQAGVEKYTTEIVLQRFRGELVLLGGRGESEADSGERPAQSYGKHRGGGDFRTPERGRAKPSESFDDLDDSIPF